VKVENDASGELIGTGGIEGLSGVRDGADGWGGHQRTLLIAPTHGFG